MGITVASDGDVYMTDNSMQGSGYNKVRKAWLMTSYPTYEPTYAVDSVQSIAGTGVGGNSADGTDATSALINNPYSLVMDSTDSVVYFVDQGNNQVRKISDGVIETVAGNVNGYSGYSGDGGDATSAYLNEPAGLAIDSDDNLYVSESSNHVIRKIDTSTGIITTIAGDGSTTLSISDPYYATSTSLHTPQGLAFSGGYLYVADAHHHQIRKIKVANGIISKVAGTGVASFSGDNGDATSATLRYPSAVAIDTSGKETFLQIKQVDTNLTILGNIYVADAFNYCIRKIDSTGKITTLAGQGGVYGYTGDGGFATSATLGGPNSIAIDASGINNVVHLQAYK